MLHFSSYVYTTQILIVLILKLNIYKQNFSLLILFPILSDEECEEMNKMKDNGAGGVLCFNESLPIMQFIVSKIDETQK